MATTLLYLAAIAMVAGLAFAVAFALSGRGEVIGVARSLALIEHAVKPQEVGRNELPAAERLVRPFLNSMRTMAGCSFKGPQCGGWSPPKRVLHQCPSLSLKNMLCPPCGTPIWTFVNGPCTESAMATMQS